MFEVIKRYRPTILTTVPTMINSMLNVPGASAEDLSSLAFLLFSRRSLADRTLRTLDERVRRGHLRRHRLS